MTHEEILTTLGNYVDYLIAGSSAEAPLWNIEKVRSGKPNKWNYVDGCMITACLSLYKTTGDEKFLKFSRDFVDYFVKDGGEIYTFDANEHNLDNINQGKNLFSSWTPSPAPRMAISGTKPSTRGRCGWTAPIWPSPSTWNTRPATTA